ncbi:MAG: anaerobic sulfatase-maturation protein [Muribaculaceae bacterium]|nr:anaerobic sulfatase-maturation protein [Muribaculaceae bacterium]
MHQLPFGEPFSVIAKPVGSACNLRCKYCYYLEKSKYYRKGDSHIMSRDTLELFIKEYIASQPTKTVQFNWHGGEALLKPVSYYEEIIRLQKKYGAGREISNTIQTNGTLLTDEWCAFFKKYNWLVGLSIDGPQELHDRYRVNRQGKSSFNDVMEGILALNRNFVDWNILATVNAANADYPDETYNFLKSLGTPFIQFTPVVERIKGDGMLASHRDDGTEVTDFSIRPDQWGRFICRVFDLWVRNDVGKVFVQLFDATLANRVGVQSPVCTMAKDCGDALAVEYNGDVYSCDHFVFPAYKLGNIYKEPLWSMAIGEKQKKFSGIKSGSLPAKCRECQYLWGCHGECPRNRFVPTEEPGRNINYLCEGYKMFFEHVTPAMDFMKAELEAERPPANIMNLFR